MCGIAGVISFDKSFAVTREVLGALSRCIAHRGPDGESTFVSGDGRCGLVHRRLAVIDPDARSNQPFTIEWAGRAATIVFNGEIYNYRELRLELSALQPDYAWKTQGDTEVLLLSYLVWGEACVEKLNGMFAVAVWDDGTLWLARDRAGQKPLYVLTRGGTTFFASEPGALENLPPSPVSRRERAGERASVDLPNRSSCDAFLPLSLALPHLPMGEGGLSSSDLNRSALEMYLRFGHTGGLPWFEGGAEQFPFDTRATLPAGIIDRGARPLGRTLTDADAVRETRARVERSVARQLVSDVPLGCFLSGGIDSSVIALCARKLGPLETFSCGFGDPVYDESAYAAAVAKHLGTKHHAFIVTPDAAADLPKIATLLGEPFGDSSILPTYYLARETRRHVTVALDGTGGDELFGGYDRYVAVKRAARLDRLLPGGVRRFLARSSALLPGSHPKGTLTRMKRFARGLALDPASRYASYLQIFDDALIAELLSGQAAEPTRNDEARPPSPLGAEGVRDALAFDRRWYLPFDLLVKTDRASMAHALEVRSPFMDPDVLELAEGLTTNQLLAGGKKRMLREAFARELPAEVFGRRKMGFAVPIGAWFRGSLRPMLRDSLSTGGGFARQFLSFRVVERLLDEHDAGRTDHSQRLFALLMLELWWSGK